MEAIIVSVNVIDNALNTLYDILSPVISKLNETLVVLESFVSVIETIEAPFEPIGPVLDGLYSVFQYVQCPSAIGEFCLRN
jgi:hypothetical protein